MSFLATIKSLLGLGSKSVTLAPGDRMLNCEDCKQEFIFDAGEQRFFKEKGFTDPKRCPKCRRKVRARMRRRGRRGGGNSHPNGNDEPRHNEGNRNENRGNNGGHGHHRGRRHSVIDGDSPYADER
jgi:hypothetical protein